MCAQNKNGSSPSRCCYSFRLELLVLSYTVIGDTSAYSYDSSRKRKKPSCSCCSIVESISVVCWHCGVCEWLLVVRLQTPLTQGELYPGCVCVCCVGAVSSPSDYIQHAINLVLLPVTDGAANLQVTSQISVLSIGASALCDVWTEHILTNKIRFR